MTVPDRGELTAGGIVLLAASLAIVLWGWGDVWTFWQHPARVALVALMVAASAAALVAPISGFRGAKVEDPADRAIFLPMAALTVLFLYLPPYADRHDLLVLDGDVTRYAGLVVCALGCVLRVVPMFVLGRRFSPAVAIQEGHTLATGGVYRFVRHPSYMGGLVGLAGWALVFRSVLGLLFLPPFVAITVRRMNAEERLLAAQFGDEYAAYRRRTWRLVPYLY